VFLWQPYSGTAARRASVAGYQRGPQNDSRTLWFPPTKMDFFRSLSAGIGKFSSKNNPILETREPKPKTTSALPPRKPVTHASTAGSSAVEPEGDREGVSLFAGSSATAVIPRTGRVHQSKPQTGGAAHLDPEEQEWESVPKQTANQDIRVQGHHGCGRRLTTAQKSSLVTRLSLRRLQAAVQATRV